MKTVIVVIFVFLFSNAAKAQNTFEKIIDTLGSAGAYSIQETFDGGYVFCGGSIYNGNDVCIVKLDSAGTIEWAKIYSGPSMEGANYIEQTPDSGYMVNAVYDIGVPFARSWLLRLDANGDTLWTKVLSGGTGATIPSMVNSMASVNNAIYGLTGYFKQDTMPIVPRVFFIAVLSNGLVAANKTYNYSSTLSSDARAIDKTYDNGFIMAGAGATSSQYSDIYVIRTNGYGDTLWTRTYDKSTSDAAMDVKQTTDSGFIVVSIIYDTIVYKYNIYLIKTDTAGDTIWTKQYFSQYEQVIYSVQQTIDNGYIMTGYSNTAVGRSLYLIKTDYTGNTLWTRRYNPNINNYGYFVRQTKDGGFIICGATSTGSYIIKTDSLGMVGNGTGIAEVNNPFDFSVYPNPSSGNFTFEVKGIPRKNANLKIYNVLNQTVYTGTLSSYKKESVDLHHLPNGIYIATLYYGARTISEKVIIHK
ncbi:MAG: T9SS type A sorting domain-containing protein [Bacteroidetes bacterium]|jgi:hypothetical protein|nr:T9SS type A sorting domain-containing protein [Bacteroidota bacterium]